MPQVLLLFHSHYMEIINSFLSSLILLLEYSDFSLLKWRFVKWIQSRVYHIVERSSFIKAVVPHGGPFFSWKQNIHLWSPVKKNTWRRKNSYLTRKMLKMLVVIFAVYISLDTKNPFRYFLLKLFSSSLR